MDAIMMAKKSTRGSFHLFCGVAASSLISALVANLFANLLSPSEYILYSIAFYRPTLVALFIPANSTDYMSLTWNYNKTAVDPNQTVRVT